VICYAGKASTSSRIPPPEVFLRKGGNSARTTSASITVEYFGFPQRAKEAFEYAVSIWESLLVTPVEIHVAAVWANLPYGALGSAGPSFWAANFDGTPKYNIYYPGPLAEKLAGEDLNDSDEYDIVAQFNSVVNRHYQSTSTPDSTEYDFITVALHELAHGLGFTSTFEVINDMGWYGRYTDNGEPFVYDLFIEHATGTNLFSSFESRSEQLATQLRSNSLYFVSPFGRGEAKVFAPPVYNEGSSISHLDPDAYPQGSSNSLMQPYINPEEINHNPGAVVQDIFINMGWVTTRISHDHLKDQEDISNPIEVRAVITADEAPGYGFLEDQVILSYSRSDVPGTVTTVMQPTGVPNEFAAELPAPGAAITYSYRIEVKDNLGRTLFSPGEFYDISYLDDINHFHDLSDDFISDSFTIHGTNSLGTWALHSPHPYPEAGADNQLNLTCQLRIPIIVSSQASLITFDEIVAVEPGEDGSAFGDADFYDYLAVEGSDDGGKTWMFLAGPYDSREDQAWIYLYESSPAVTQSYYRHRVIDLRETFSPGEEVLIRFRLFSDPFGNGWGWAIDNLRIQVDDTHSEILHNHIDYALFGSQAITFPVSVSDDLLVDKVVFEHSPISSNQERDTIVVEDKEGIVGFTFDMSGFGLGTVIFYRFEVIDGAGNGSALPPEGHFKMTLIQFKDTVDRYNGTNALTSDFVGNFIHPHIDNNQLRPFLIPLNSATMSSLKGQKMKAKSGILSKMDTMRGKVKDGTTHTFREPVHRNSFIARNTWT
jgi:hypothetical protein